MQQVIKISLLTQRFSRLKIIIMIQRDKTIKIIDLHESNEAVNDYKYWLSKTPDERIKALREQYRKIRGWKEAPRIEKTIVILDPPLR
jgi:hypothetical protein